MQTTTRASNSLNSAIILLTSAPAQATQPPSSLIYVNQPTWPPHTAAPRHPGPCSRQLVLQFEKQQQQVVELQRHSSRWGLRSSCLPITTLQHVYCANAQSNIWPQTPIPDCVTNGLQYTTLRPKGPSQGIAVIEFWEFLHQYYSIMYPVARWKLEHGYVEQIFIFYSRQRVLSLLRHQAVEPPCTIPSIVDMSASMLHPVYCAI